MMAISLLAFLVVLTGVGAYALDQSEATIDLMDGAEMPTFSDDPQTTGADTVTYSANCSISNGKATSTFDSSEYTFSIKITPNDNYVVPKDKTNITVTDASGSAKAFEYSTNSTRSYGYITVYNVDSNLKVTATCLKKVTVTVTMNAGTISTQTGTAIAGEGYTMTLPTKAGYNFPLSTGLVVKVGTSTTTKYTYTASSGKIVIATDAFNANSSSITITADYDPKEYTITSSITNGTMGEVTGDVEHNASISAKIAPDNGYVLPATVMIDNGTDRVTISVDQTSGDYKYDSDGTVTVSKVQGNVKITGTCSAASYKITYYLDGKEIVLSPSKYTYGQAVTLPTDVYEDGVIFDRWVDKDGNEITKISSTTYGEVSVYAEVHYDRGSAKTPLVYGMALCILLLIILPYISRK